MNETLMTEEFAEWLYWFHNHYPNSELNATQAATWWNKHNGTNLDRLYAAANVWLNDPATCQWPPNPPAQLDNAIRQANMEHRQALPAARSKCDGSGWIEHDERSSSPCPACNPILHTVFNNPTMYAEYRDGKSLAVISDDVMKQNGVLHAVDSMPTACKPALHDDPDDPVRRRPVTNIHVGHEL